MSIPLGIIDVVVVGCQRFMVAQLPCSTVRKSASLDNPFAYGAFWRIANCDRGVGKHLRRKRGRQRAHHRRLLIGNFTRAVCIGSFHQTYQSNCGIRWGCNRPDHYAVPPIWLAQYAWGVQTRLPLASRMSSYPIVIPVNNP